MLKELLQVLVGPGARQWRIQGARGPGSRYFWQSQFNSFTLYTVSGKNIFEIEFGFYSGQNPRSFWKCEGCMRVCV